jgi:hypothetical protein
LEDGWVPFVWFELDMVVSDGAGSGINGSVLMVLRLLRRSVVSWI